MNTRIIKKVVLENTNNCGYRMMTRQTIPLYLNEFDNIHDLKTWLNNTPLNYLFDGGGKRSSIKTTNNSWSGSNSYDEAEQLLINGWSQMATKLSGMLKHDSKFAPLQKSFNTFDVVGSQASVPRYLQGVPTNMVNRKNKPAPQKILNVYKSIAYNCGVSAYTMEQESLKALQIVNKLESQNIRVNLFVVSSCFEKNDRCITNSICIKRSSEKMNVSKVAFPLVHPSMLRRICFNIIEHDPNVTHKFTKAYGYPTFDNDLRKLLRDQYKDSVFIPAVVNTHIDKINTLDDLKNLR